MKYRKRHIDVEAEQFFPDKRPWPEGVEQYVAQRIEDASGNSSEWYGWRVRTLEGQMAVRPGDWIVTSSKGERYALNPDIFEETYEPA